MVYTIKDKAQLILQGSLPHAMAKGNSRTHQNKASQKYTADEEFPPCLTDSSKELPLPGEIPNFDMKLS